MLASDRELRGAGGVMMVTSLMSLSSITPLHFIIRKLWRDRHSRSRRPRVRMETFKFGFHFNNFWDFVNPNFCSYHIISSNVFNFNFAVETKMFTTRKTTWSGEPKLVYASTNPKSKAETFQEQEKFNFLKAGFTFQPKTSKWYLLKFF